jgi:hypothetical protein
MEIFDAVVLNVLCKCNGYEAGLCVMVGGGVGGWNWLCLALGILRYGNFSPQIVLIKQSHLMLASN